MYLFLDIDGVLHELDRANGLFSRENHLAKVLRDFPHVELVISSAWRCDYSLKNLKTFFLTDLRHRIVGATPIFEIYDASDLAGSRYREIITYLGSHGEHEPWVALDDDASLFPAECAELVLCANGFKIAEEIALRAALDQIGMKG